MGFIPKSSSSGILAGALKLIMCKGIYIPAEVFLEGRSSPNAPRSVVAKPAVAPKAPGAVAPRDLGLTPRQGDVLYLILQGKPAKLICRELGLSASTVKIHTSAVLRALNVTTRTQAVVAAGRIGLSF
jgi:DNA-binding NarL/FixJ family response regulator